MNLDNPLQLLKDPYLYIIGFFGWLAVELLKQEEKSTTWFIGLALLMLSVILLLIRFVISLYRDYLEKLFRGNYQSIIEQQSALLNDTQKLLATHTSTDMMAQTMVQNKLRGSEFQSSGYRVDHDVTETRAAD